MGHTPLKLMMEGKCLEVIDLCVDVASERFVAAAKEHRADIISCSALLTTTMGEMKNVVDLVKADPELSGRVKIMVGGAPVTDAFCQKIGADCYTSDATSDADAALGFCTEAL